MSQMGVPPVEPTSLSYELGRQLQALALLMRKHRINPRQQVCDCGRLAMRELPMFGPRCDIACRQWDLVHSAMRRIVAHTNPGNATVVGRAAVEQCRQRPQR